MGSEFEDRPARGQSRNATAFFMLMILIVLLIL